MTMLTTMYEESVRRTQARIRKELFLGRGTHTGRLYHLKPEDYLATHLHLIGASNFGKSYYNEHLLHEFAALRIPASLIDPHGDHAAEYWRFLERIPRLRRQRTVIHFKPGSAANAAGFNPFQCGLADPSEVASLVLEAFMKVWGADSFNETPRLERILRNMFYMFVVNRLPLTQADQFLLVANRSFRESLLTAVPDERMRANWLEIERLPQTEKLERFESTWNRVQRFIAVRPVAEIFAAENNSLNFTEILKRGQILIANLSLLHSTEAQSLVGTLLVNAIYHAAKRRPEGRRKHWVLAIDEFPQFVTTDIARSLDQIRKFGVRLILAHQHLAQMPEDLLRSVLTNAKIRAVFGGLSRADAEIVAREHFTGAVRGDQTKYTNRQTKFRPILVERDVESFSESDSAGESDADSWSRGSSYGGGDSHGDSRSQRYADGLTDETMTHTLSGNSSYADSSGSSGSRSTTRARASGRTWGRQMVIDHEEFIEETSRQYWSLDEEWEKLVARIMNLDRREALIKVLNRPTIDITTPEIKHRSARRGRKKTCAKVEPLQKTINPPKAGRLDDLPEDFRE
jgi:hypothetical protein